MMDITLLDFFIYIKYRQIIRVCNQVLVSKMRAHISNANMIGKVFLKVMGKLAIWAGQEALNYLFSNIAQNPKAPAANAVIALFSNASQK